VITLPFARTMARYNAWMNERLYDCCERLSDSERRRDRGAFFKSIHGTLNHLLLADRVWMGRFTGQPCSVGSLADELYADFTELRKERGITDSAIAAWISSLTEEDLAGTLSYMSIVNPTERRYPLGFAIMHFFNHQTHHRGQLTTLLSQSGIDPGITDLIWLPGADEGDRARALAPPIAEIPSNDLEGFTR
jgi:uncharacterized damage-inducible protein DinB